MAGEVYPTQITGVYQVVNPMAADPYAGLRNGIAVGEPTLSSSSTKGFVWIPSIVTMTTSTPVTVTGMVPICFDQTNYRLALYSTGYGGWRFIATTTA